MWLQLGFAPWLFPSKKEPLLTVRSSNVCTRNFMATLLELGIESVNVSKWGMKMNASTALATYEGILDDHFPKYFDWGKIASRPLGYQSAIVVLQNNPEAELPPGAKLEMFQVCFFYYYYFLFV